MQMRMSQKRMLKKTAEDGREREREREEEEEVRLRRRSRDGPIEARDRHVLLSLDTTLML